jgi:hypothetical protein
MQSAFPFGSPDPAAIVIEDHRIYSHLVQAVYQTMRLRVASVIYAAMEGKDSNRWASQSHSFTVPGFHGKSVLSVDQGLSDPESLVATLALGRKERSLPFDRAKSSSQLASLARLAVIRGPYRAVRDALIANPICSQVASQRSMKRSAPRLSPRDLSAMSKGNRRRLQGLLRKMLAAHERALATGLASTRLHEPPRRIIE